MRFTREDPPGGGPVANAAGGAGRAGESGVPEGIPARDWVAVLAVDMPHVTARTLDRLREAALNHDGAFLADARGRQLAGVVARTALTRRRPADPTGQPLHLLLDPLDLRLVPATGNEGHDIDTWADLP
ncbi:MAG: NTP transferase domain-containing protein [Nocardioides sp.]